MKNQTRVVKGTMPLRLEGTNKKAVIVQHGYNGYPHEMYGLAGRLNSEGYTVVVPRLPGHATNGRDFKSTNWQIWLNHIRNIYIDLSSEYESVSIAGLSMGGLLSILLAAEFSPDKIILLAPAVSIKFRLMYLTPLLRFVIPEMKREWDIEKETDPIRRKLGEEYWSHLYTAQLASVIKLSRMAKKGLPGIECPVYMMFSEIDTHVSLSSADIIEKGLSPGVSLKKHVLKNSPHVFFEGPENEFVLQKVADWLNE